MKIVYGYVYMVENRVSLHLYFHFWLFTMAQGCHRAISTRKKWMTWFRSEDAAGGSNFTFHFCLTKKKEWSYRQTIIGWKIQKKKSFYNQSLNVEFLLWTCRLCNLYHWFHVMCMTLHRRQTRSLQRGMDLELYNYKT